MTNPETLLGVFDRTLSILGLIREGKRRRDEQTDQALYALYAVLAETRSYVFDLNHGKQRDNSREQSIALLWNKTAVPLRHIDRDLAERCLLKGSYWLEPEIWDDCHIQGSQISLDQVFNEARKLIYIK